MRRSATCCLFSAAPAPMRGAAAAHDATGAGEEPDVRKPADVMLLAQMEMRLGALLANRTCVVYDSDADRSSPAWQGAALRAALQPALGQLLEGRVQPLRHYLHPLRCVLHQPGLAGVPVGRPECVSFASLPAGGSSRLPRPRCCGSRPPSPQRRWRAASVSRRQMFPRPSWRQRLVRVCFHVQRQETQMTRPPQVTSWCVCRV